jgi:hypothetical protein
VLRVLLTSILVALLGHQDSSEIDRLVVSLGSDSVEVRGNAQDRLIELGVTAVPALEKCFAVAEPEVRARAKAVMAEIERLERDRRHDETERKRLLEAHRKQDDEKKDPHLDGAAPGGARFQFLVRRFGDGFTVQTFTTNHLVEDAYHHRHPGRVDFDVVEIMDKDGRPLKIERCGDCSPKIVFAGSASAPIRVHIKGVQLWFSPHEVDFSNPQNGERKQVGEFTFEVDWPVLKLTSRRPWPKDVLDEAGAEFTYEVKPEVEGSPPIFGGVGPGGGGGGRYGGQKKYWCQCDDGPKPVPEKAKPELLKAYQVSNRADKNHRLNQVAKIQYLFLRPIEEPFDFTVELSPK